MKVDLSILGSGPFEYPKFEEKQGKKWVEYGSGDDYAHYLHELYITSAIHNAICNGVADAIAGDGFQAEWERNDGSKEAWLHFHSLVDRDLIRCTALDLKLYGQFYWCVIYNTLRTKIVEVKHIPVHTVRAGIPNEQGDVDLYYYAKEWKRGRPVGEPEPIKAFNPQDTQSAKQIIHGKRYDPEAYFYSLPDYVGGSNWIEASKKIADFHNSNLDNGMFPGWAVNLRNGVPSDEERREIERKINDKFGGPQGAGRVLITFNEGPEQTPELIPLESNGNSDMFQYLSAHCRDEIISAHRVTSPLLFGIRSEGGGFGSNADEMRDAYSLFYSTVVRPFQDLILDAIDQVMSVSNQVIEIQMKPWTPADFIDLGVTDSAGSYNGAQIQSAVQVMEGVANGSITQEQAIVILVQMLQFPSETAQALFNPQESATIDFHKECSGTCMSRVPADAAEWLINMGEEAGEGWEEVMCAAVDYDLDDDLNTELEAVQVTMARTVRSAPGKESEQDTSLFKVRYRYVEKPGPTRKKDENDREYPSRDFCQRMMRANKIYRKEDIMKAENQAVNPGWGPRGDNTYSIWKFKGGGGCRHAWQRVVYLKSGGKITAAEARRIVNRLPIAERAAAKIQPNPASEKVSISPVNQTNAGFLPGNPQGKNYRGPQQ